MALAMFFASSLSGGGTDQGDRHSPPAPGAKANAGWIKRKKTEYTSKAYQSHLRQMAEKEESDAGWITRRRKHQKDKPGAVPTVAAKADVGWRKRAEERRAKEKAEAAARRAEYNRRQLGESTAQAYVAKFNRRREKSDAERLSRERDLMSDDFLPRLYDPAPKPSPAASDYAAADYETTDDESSDF